MGKRHEKGTIVIVCIIVFCGLLMYLSKDSLFNIPAKDNRVTDEINIVTNDIAITDMAEENKLAEEQDDLWILADYLIYARNESSVLTALFPAILLIYIIIIGPVVYFVLKRRDKMEWMWMIIPALSIIFAGMIALFGKSFTVESPVIDSLTVVSPDKDDVVYFTCTSLADEEFNLSYDERVKSIMPIYEEQYAFSKSFVRLDVSANRQGTVKCKLSMENNIPVGTIQNNTEWKFKHIMLCYGNSYCVLPALAPNKMLYIDAKTWKEMQDGDEAPRMNQDMVKKDCDRILKFAYLKYFDSSRKDQIQISAVIDEFEPVIKKSDEDLISYGLYQQWENIK